MRSVCLQISLLLLISVSSGCRPAWDLLSQGERAVLTRVKNHWETWVPERKKAGTAPLMMWDELYDGLGPEEMKFLDRIRAIDPKKHFGFQGEYLGTNTEGVRFRKIEDQKITRFGKPETLDPQYLPEPVHEAYERMMEAMQKDLGRRLYVESGYRSPAYQLYVFVTFIHEHGFSLKETGKWVALPGYSEHGAPHRQAIDFINQEGINGEGPNGEDVVEEFEALPEYAWLQSHAHEYGFELSYPRGQKGITFEPWHWCFLGSPGGSPN